MSTFLCSISRVSYSILFLRLRLNSINNVFSWLFEMFITTNWYHYWMKHYCWAMISIIPIKWKNHLFIWWNKISLKASYCFIVNTAEMYKFSSISLFTRISSLFLFWFISSLRSFNQLSECFNHLFINSLVLFSDGIEYLFVCWVLHQRATLVFISQLSPKTHGNCVVLSLACWCECISCYIHSQSSLKE
jgi:hypothetical protein